MMCHRIGRVPTDTSGFGLNSVSSRSLVPWPPHNMTTFTVFPLSLTFISSSCFDISSNAVNCDGRPKLTAHCQERTRGWTRNGGAPAGGPTDGGGPEALRKNNFAVAALAHALSRAAA